MDANGPVFSHIACCIEESAPSAAALGEARRLRAGGPGHLSVLHVGTVSPEAAIAGVVAVLGNYMAEERRWLDEQIRPGESPVFLEGAPAPAVCAWARKTGHPDLLVAAAHRGRAERILLGSFAGYLAHHSPCSVLLVRPVDAGNPPSDLP